MIDEKSTTMNKEKGISLNDMVQYRDRLLNQKQFLTDVLSQIDKQILALQVERLHLRNSLLGNSKCSGQEILPDLSVKNNSVKNEPVKENSNDLAQQKLDLSLAPSLNDLEEFEDDLDFLESP